MKMAEAIELGEACGLSTPEECLNNVHIHCLSLFPYTKLQAELDELDADFDESFRDDEPDYTAPDGGKAS